MKSMCNMPCTKVLYMFCMLLSTQIGPNNCGRTVSLSWIYKSTAWDMVDGNSKLDSSIIIVHKSNKSTSHGTELKNVQLCLHAVRSSVSGTRQFSAPQRWGAMYMTSGIPLGTLGFLEGLIRWAFQTPWMSFNSSCWRNKNDLDIA